jgi:hypothetical protein
MQVFLSTVCEITHQDVVIFRIFAAEFHHKRPSEWKKQAEMTLPKATESYVVEEIPGYHFRSSNFYLVGFQQVS